MPKQQNISPGLLLIGLLVLFILSALVIGLVNNFASASPSSSSEISNEKQVVLTASALTRGAGLTNPAMLPPNPLTPAPVPSLSPTSAPVTGIHEGNAPFPGSYAVIENQWKGRVGNQLVTVYAGRYTQQPEQGLLVVQINLADNANAPLQEYRTLLKEGKIRITAANYSLITVVTEKGSTVVFDLATRLFK